MWAKYAAIMAIAFYILWLWAAHFSDCTSPRLRWTSTIANASSYRISENLQWVNTLTAAAGVYRDRLHCATDRNERELESEA